MKTTAVTVQEFFRRNAAFLTNLTVTGLALGLLAGLLTVRLEKPVYEGRVVCLPLRPANDADIPHDVWLATEMAAMGSPANLSRAARNLNLEYEWGMSLGEATEEIRKRLEISVFHYTSAGSDEWVNSPGRNRSEGSVIPDTALVEITVRSPSNTEAANIANGVIGARCEQFLSVHRHESLLQKEIIPGKLAVLKKSCDEKREALLAVMRQHGIPAAAATGPLTDADILTQTLYTDIAAACDAWRGEAIQLEAFQAQLAAAAAALQTVPQYAEILEEAYPSVTPVYFDAMGYIFRFTLNGTAIGLGIALLVAVMFRRGPAGDAPVPPLSQIPLAVGDY